MWQAIRTIDASIGTLVIADSIKSVILQNFMVNAGILKVPLPQFQQAQATFVANSGFSDREFMMFLASMLEEHLKAQPNLYAFKAYIDSVVARFLGPALPAAPVSEQPAVRQEQPTPPTSPTPPIMPEQPPAAAPVQPTTSATYKVLESTSVWTAPPVAPVVEAPKKPAAEVETQTLVIEPAMAENVKHALASRTLFPGFTLNQVMMRLVVACSIPGISGEVEASLINGESGPVFVVRHRTSAEDRTMCYGMFIRELPGRTEVVTSSQPQKRFAVVITS